MTVTVPTWTLGDRLRKARRIAGLDQRAMADYMGLSNSAIGLYETDARLPKLAVLRVWAVRTGVPLEWLRYGDDQDFSDGPGGASTPTKCSHAYVLAEAA